METINFVQFLSSKSLAPPINATTSPIKTSQILSFQRRRRNSPILNSSNSTESSEDNPQPQPAPSALTSPDTVEIRFKRSSRKRKNKRLRADGAGSGQPAIAKAPPAAPKKWEEMSLIEKTIELYMGEKGLLFWLNKFAYASIFIVIGVWILFRFVGPSLNLYQLDAPPLPPSDMFKGS